MLVDFENIDYIKVCPETHTLQIPDCYIPASTWGFIMGDITEQKDLIELISNIEIGITPEQIALLQNVEKEINEINNSLDMKVDVSEVYTKREIDNKGYLTEHQSLAGYATESWVYGKGYISTETDPIWSAEKHKYALKSELPNIAGLATESWVKEQGYLTEHQTLTNYYTKNEVDTAIENVKVDLTGYATEEWVNNKGYLTEHQDISHLATKEEIPSLEGYATESWVKEQGYLTEHQSLTDYYTKSEIDDKGYLTEHQSLTNYYTKNEVDTAIENVEVDLTGYATESWVKEQGYLTEHQSLDNYYNKSEVDDKIDDKLDTNKIWSGTQSQWDALSATEQNSYIIAMIQQ